MANSSFPSRVRHPHAGESVSAGITGAGPRALEGRTNYLKEVIDAIEAGRALMQRDVAVAPDVLEWQPVYWDAENQRYAPAQAAVENDLSTGTLVTAASSDVAGLIINKKAGNRADLILWGLVKCVSLANAVDGEVTPGRYYLSAVEPGKLVRQRPAVTVSVAFVLGPLDACDENTWVLVMPQMRDFLEDHVHYQLPLVARPAGCVSPPAEGDRHVIVDADDTLQGWLPADHERFAGKAPPGALFGYNFAADDGLSRLWPPIPLTSVLLEEFKPDDGVRVGGRVPATKIQFTLDGIWWMTDCYDEVPWPTALETCLSSSSFSSSVSLSSSSSSEAQPCPAPVEMELILSFIKMTFATDKTVVTSLQPGDGQPLEFVNCDGVVSKTGDLFAKLKLDLLISPDEFYGGQVIKGVGSDNKFQRGWATEGVIAQSDKVVITSTRQRRLTPGDTGTPLVHQGIVRIDINTDPTDRELTPVIVRLGSALEDVYKGKPYLSLPNGRNSTLALRFNVPPTGTPVNPQMKLRVLAFGRLTGTLTDLNVRYSRIARPTDDTPTPLTDTETELPFVSDLAVTADAAVELESDVFDVVAGDTVYITIERLTTNTPSYAAEIGMLRMVGIIVAES